MSDEQCAIHEGGQPCQEPAICNYHDARGVTLLCERHMRAWLGFSLEDVGVHPMDGPKPAKRGPYRKGKP